MRSDGPSASRGGYRLPLEARWIGCTEKSKMVVQYSVFMKGGWMRGRRGDKLRLSPAFFVSQHKASGQWPMHSSSGRNNNQIVGCDRQ